MENNFKNMDDLFKESLSDFKAETNMDMWDSIAKGTAKRLFFRFIPSRFNIYYLASLVLIGSAGAAFVLSGSEDNTTIQPIVNEVDEANLNQLELNMGSEVIESEKALKGDENIESTEASEEILYEEALNAEMISADETQNQGEILNENPTADPVEDEMIEEVPDESTNTIPEDEEVESGEVNQSMGTIMQIEVETIEEDESEIINESSSPVISSGELDSLKMKNSDTVIKKEEKIHYIEKSKKIRRKIK